MTPKEKAKHLFILFEVDRFDHISGHYTDVNETKEHCLMCVDEIIKSNPHEVIEKPYIDSGGNDTGDFYYETNPNNDYWLDVKKEINSYDPSN